MKILMVCLGNICRSAMAEGILRDKAEERGAEIEVDSAGTGNYHIGEAPDRRAIDLMAKKGHDISHMKARQFEVKDFDRFDRIYAMDTSNYNNIMALARNDSDKAKVNLALNVTHPGENLEVADPYFGGAEGFVEVYEQLDHVSEVIVNEVLSSNED
ncbi:MAG TPA: low molecular weight protein-tyrosine-phosphatase [Cryomorphaceae bacterium]|nr:low molecular weight protein-tyrosine-phosphatase [Cryomorphaceae bacterium]